MNEALKIAREEKKVAQIRATKEILIAILSNPAVEIVGAYAAVEYLQQRYKFGSITGTAAEATVGAAVVAQMLAPYAPSIIQAGAEGIKSIAAIAPLALKAGG